LVNELRDFGLPLPSIVILKDTLLKEFDLLGLIVDIFEDDELVIKEIGVTLKGAEMNLLNTNLAQLIYSTIILKSDVHILISKDGNCIVMDESPVLDTFVSSSVLNAPYISIPLNYIISEFVARESLYDLKSLESVLNISKEEQKILSLVRAGNAESIKRVTKHK
jgi:hypothetical protein